MTIKTRSGSVYTFISVDNTLRTEYNGREIIVRQISNIQVGERLYVKGVVLNPITYQRTTEEIYFMTSPISEIY